MTDDRKKVVAWFLKSEPRYLELGLRVEAALGLLREEADRWVLERVREEMDVLGKTDGWEVKPAPEAHWTGWLLRKENAGWSGGIWVERPSGSPLELEVGVSGWPDSMNKRCFLGAGRKLVADFREKNRDAWSEHDHNQDRNMQAAKWRFHGDRDIRLLTGDRAAAANEIVVLVTALLEAAGSARVPECPE